MKFDLFNQTDLTKVVKSVKQKKAKMNYMPNTTASEVGRKVVKGCRLIGLTRGQFSLIDLVYSILQNIGSADVVVCTWSAGIKDLNTVKWMTDTKLLRSFGLITDHSYVTRKNQYILDIVEFFGKENIRTSEIHAKFVLLWNENYKIAIRASMNLNANRTCETFEIDDDEEIFEFYKGLVDELFVETPQGFTPDSSVVNRALDRSFANLKNQFDWQSNG
jgi:hypothetical protein